MCSGLLPNVPFFCFFYVLGTTLLRRGGVNRRTLPRSGLKPARAASVLPLRGRTNLIFRNLAIGPESRHQKGLWFIKIYYHIMIVISLLLFLHRFILEFALLAC
ncbi:hypothetical protein BDW75DRAFT_144070 [Aspergillus navahoensis]